jgi:hypothetical protein
LGFTGGKLAAYYRLSAPEQVPPFPSSALPPATCFGIIYLLPISLVGKSSMKSNHGVFGPGGAGGPFMFIEFTYLLESQ